MADSTKEDWGPLIRATEDWIPFNKQLGIKVEELRQGFARMRVPFRPELVGDPIRPALHGGVLSALIDACGGVACFTMIDTQDRLSTVDLRIDYLRPGPMTDVVCESEVIRMGNRVAVVKSVACGAGSDDQVALGMAVYSVRRVE